MSDFCDPVNCSPTGFSVHGFPGKNMRGEGAVPFSFPEDVPGPGTEPVCPALAGGFFTTEPPGKPVLLVVQFSCSVVSNSLRPHESQRTRPPRPSPTPGVHSISCPSSRWCHPAISSSVVPFSSCPQSLPASESFLVSQLFAWGGQSIGVWALASVLPKNTQDWSPLEWTGWISLQSKGLSRVFSNTTVQKHQFFALSFLHSPTLTSIHDYWKYHSPD